MAAFSWTYTVNHQDRTERNKKLNQVLLASTTGTYVAGGISLSGGPCGLPTGNIESVEIQDSNGDGYVYQWNRANGTIQMFETTSTSAYGVQKLVEVTSAVSPTVALTVSVTGY